MSWTQKVTLCFVVAFTILTGCGTNDSDFETKHFAVANPLSVNYLRQVLDMDQLIYNFYL